MTLPERTVIVRQLPQACGGKEGSLFLRELADSICTCIRPNVVLDCSCVPEVDKDALHLLLCCLEESMKRNGDVRLACVTSEARKVLEAVGLERLFKSFASIPEAVQSYRRPTIARVPLPAVDSNDQPAANAA